MSPFQSRLRRGIALLVVPMLALSMLLLAFGFVQQTAHSQELSSDPLQEVEAPQAPEDLPTCDPNNPIPGQSARLISDDEILFFYKYDTSYLRNQVINWDNVNKTLVSGPSKSWSGLAKVATGSWLNAVASDVNKDRKAELFAGFKNVDSDLAAIAEPYTTVSAPDWYCSNDRENGGKLEDVDVAAGDLDRKKDDEVAIFFRDDAEDWHMRIQDGNSSGVIANSDGWSSSNQFYDSTERGNIHHGAVAVGDLNGDGYKDEIVTAFKDSGNDLQVLVQRRQDDGSLLLILYYDSYTATPKFDTIADSGPYQENIRPVDVATGDLDGDAKDEIVVAFRNGHFSTGVVTLLVIDVTGEDTTTHQLSWTNNVYKDISITTDYAYAAPFVSVAAADLEGDGYDEIAVGFNVTYQQCGQCDEWFWQQRLYTYEYARYQSPDWISHCGTATTACLYQRPGTWKSTAYQYDSDTVDDKRAEAHVSLAAGDIDQDGMAEIAFGRILAVWNDSARVNNTLEIYAFDADASVNNGLAAKAGSPYQVDPGSSAVEEFALAMGDQDGDSLWGEYTGNCYVQKEAVLQAFVHAPPFWPEGYGLNGIDNDYRTEGGFGVDVTVGGGSGETTSTSMGGSVTIGAEIEKIPKIGGGATGSFTSEWEYTTSHSTEKTTTSSNGLEVSTLSPLNVDNGEGEEPEWETISMIEQYYRCYDYNAGSEFGTLPVCTPVPEGWTLLAPTTTKWWYEYGPDTYPRSWVPLGLNLAEGRVASQSSDYDDETPPGKAIAAWAVDGDTNGDFYDGSVSATNSEQNAWWQVDLGGLQWIDAIQIWNRTDCCADDLSNFYVFFTDQLSFPSNDPNVLLHADHVWHWPEAEEPEPPEPYTGPAGVRTIVPVDRHARMVRIQLTGVNNLQLAEVQVYGMPGVPDQWPKQISPTTFTSPPGSYTLTWRDGRQQTINEKLYMFWNLGTLLIKPGGGDGKFSTGVGQGKEEVYESGSGESFSFGMEVKKGIKLGSDWSWGNAHDESVVTTWDGGVTFSGLAQGLVQAPSGKSYGSSTYTLIPYVWKQRSTPLGGGTQEYLVLDYIVPSATLTSKLILPSFVEGAMEMLNNSSETAEELSNAPLVTPTIPLIDSPTHPDPAAWYTSHTATFTWAQQPGDPATVTDYHWYLDQKPDTIPQGLHLGPVTSYTYDYLRDGVWYLHVRAMSDSEAWSEPGHRMIHVDANPPQVSLALDPPAPNGQGGWYVTPVTVSASAEDGSGSGVTGLEISIDGVSWQPYVAPWIFSADTPGKTVYARATDAAGLTSTPISTTFKIDRTPPSSHVSGGAGAGTLVAEVIANSAGNQELVLAGAIADSLSGRAGMDIVYDGVDGASATAVGSWYPLPDQTIEVSWYYTATHQLGAGYHIFTGQAFDVAGNQETSYEIGRVLWPPLASPDLGGSSLAATPSVVRPGDTVLLTLVARNGGFQEAHVAISDVLPAGLDPVLEALPADVVYDPATRSLTWPAQLLWPGQSARHSFLAQVDASLGATTLESQATFHAFWPNTDLLPPAERQQFLDREQTVVAKSSVTVNPNLPPGVDFTPPWGYLIRPAMQIVNGAQLTLEIQAAEEARWMYLREWTPDPTSGDWRVGQDRGWVDFSPSLDWTLSNGQGVKYLGVWLADAAGNVSPLTEQRLVFVNRMDGSQLLADGQRVQYRGLLKGNEFIAGVLTTLTGDPDAFLWKPRNAFWPDRYTDEIVQPGQQENFSNQFAPEAGRFLLDVQAVGASEYDLTLTRQAGQMAIANLSQPLKTLPAHPLTVSDPLSAGQVGPVLSPPPYRIYMPVVSRR